MLARLFRQRTRWKLILALAIVVPGSIRIGARVIPGRRGTGPRVTTIYLVSDGGRIRATTANAEEINDPSESWDRILARLNAQAVGTVAFILKSPDPIGIFVPYARSYIHPLANLHAQSPRWTPMTPAQWNSAFGANIGRYDELSEAMIWFFEVQINRWPWAHDPAIYWLVQDGGYIETLKRRQREYLLIDRIALTGEVASIVLFVWGFIYLSVGLHRLPQAIRRRSRAKSGQCVSCGYDRAGLAPDAPCPECGDPSPASRPDR